MGTVIEYFRISRMAVGHAAHRDGNARQRVRQRHLRAGLEAAAPLRFLLLLELLCARPKQRDCQRDHLLNLQQVVALQN